MKNWTRVSIGIALTIAAAPTLLAQAPPPGGGAPKVLQIGREEVKYGKAAAHQKWEMGWPKAFNKANWPTNYLACTSVTGPSEAWFLTGYESFAALEKDRNDLDNNAVVKAEDSRLSQGDAEFVSSSRTIIAALRPDLSNPVPVELPKMRYFRVITFRVRPGHDGDFADAAKIVRAAYEKANVELPWATYQVVSGMPGPTFLVIGPMKSMDEIDASFMNAKKIQDAEGEDGQKKLAKMASDGYLTVESNIYAFDPKMSYPSKEFAAADPDFWNPKPAMATKRETSKSTTKQESKPASKP